MMEESGHLETVVPREGARPIRSRKSNKVKAPISANDTAAPDRRKPRKANGRRNGQGQVSHGSRITTAPAEVTASTLSSPAGEVSASVNVSLTNQSKGTLAETIAAIREHHRQRQVFLRAELRLNNQIKALLRRGLTVTADQSIDAPADEDGHVAAEDQNLRADESGPRQTSDPTLSSPDFSSLATEPLRMAMGYIKKFRTHHQKILVGLAEQLPVYPWVGSVPGFGAMGLGQIVGEAGDLAQYSTVSKLWKRMGLAVIDGGAQRRCKDKAKAELHGFNPRRRSIMYSIGDAMVKSNSVKNGDERQPLYYRQLYLDRKAFERGNLPDASDMHVHRRAQRYLEKRLLKHLWQQWRRNDGTAAV